MGKALNTIETHLDGRIASITVTQAMFEATGTGPSDTEGFVKYPLSLEGVMGCVLFREDADRIKVSLRSRTSLDVNGWARKSSKMTNYIATFRSLGKKYCFRDVL